MDSLLKVIDRVLVVVLFMTLGGFLWFVFAVSGALLGIPLGYQQWTKLWQPLFQPALGLLMAGAIASGIANWVRQRRNS